MHNGQNDHDAGQPGENTSNKKFYLIVVPEHGKPDCKQFDTKDELIDELRSLSKKRLSCYVIEGERWHISLPPRKLLRPDGSVEADISFPKNNIAIDVDGFLFEDPEVFDDDDDDFNSD